MLSGCAAGQRAQTSEEVSVVDGGSVQIGNVALRNIGVSGPVAGPSYPKAGTADLSLDIVNNATTADALISVSSPAAASVVLTAPTGPTGSSAAGSSPASSTPTSTPPASSTPASGAPASTAPAGAVIDIPATRLVSINSDQGSGVVSLTNLTSPLVPGQTIQITFTFRNAGAVTALVPVRLQPNQTGGPTVDVSPSGAG